MMCLLAYTVFRAGVVTWNQTEKYDALASAESYYLREIYSSRMDMWVSTIWNGGCIYTVIIDGFIPLVLSIWLNLWISKTELTITNKRIYGKKAYGKTFEVRLDDVSFVNNSFPGGIVLNCVAGQIKIPNIQNRDRACAFIRKLLLERQNEISAFKQEMIFDIPNEIKKYSELLSTGIITKEEFEEKKIQLLNKQTYS